MEPLRLLEFRFVWVVIPLLDPGSPGQQFRPDAPSRWGKRRPGPGPGPRENEPGPAAGARRSRPADRLSYLQVGWTGRVRSPFRPEQLSAGGRARSRVGGHRPCAREGPKTGRWPRVLLGGPCRDLPRPPPPPFCLGRRHRQPRAPGAPRDAQGWAASPRGPCRTSMRPEGGRGARGFCTAPCRSFFFSFIGKCFTPPY